MNLTQKEIATLLVKEGVATQKSEAEDYTEANSNPSLKALGNATIANCLEMLGGHGIVTDVQPTISEHGMGSSIVLTQTSLLTYQTMN